MKKSLAMLLTASLVTGAALAADADGAPDPKKDPRRTYSTDGWELVWADEFDGRDPLGYLENWRHEVGFLRNHEPQYYTSNRVENCRVENGVLSVTMSKRAELKPRRIEIS